MTKEELLKLKNETQIATKYSARLGKFSEKTYSLPYMTIKELENTDGALADIDKRLTNLVINAAKYGIDTTRILVNIDWDFFKTENGLISPSPDDSGEFNLFAYKRLYDMLLIQIKYSLESLDRNDHEIIEDKLNRISSIFIINYSRFISLLGERGYDMPDLTFDEFVYQNKYSLDFSIEFEPQHTRTRKIKIGERNN